MVKKAIEALRRIGAEGRSIEEAVSYSVGHRFRIEILVALHDGPKSTQQLARIVGHPTSTVSHHIEELVADGWLEVAKTKQVGNLVQQFYAIVTVPKPTDADLEKLSAHERQALRALTVKSAVAEAFSSLWAGRLRDDPHALVAWERFDLGDRGREELRRDQEQFLARVEAIRERDAKRRSKTGERGSSCVLATFAFARGRDTPPAPPSGDD